LAHGRWVAKREDQENDTKALLYFGQISHVHPAITMENNRKELRAKKILMFACRRHLRCR
jgi:hypothetical protein